MSFTHTHLDEAKRIIDALDADVIERMAETLATLRHKGGRLFFLGVGGSAGNCSHAVNDFRKIVGIEAYAPTDNVSELTARTNDEGWETIFAEWLKVSRLKADDALFIFSVGGGNLEKNVSPNLVRALQYAKTVGAKVLGVVGRDGGYTAKVGDAVCIVPTVNPDAVTPHSEAFQAVVWHLLVSHPALKAKQTKWEGVEKAPANGMKRAVFLDRDGVLNKAFVRNGKPYSPDTIEEMIIVPDAAAALERATRPWLRADRCDQPAGYRARTAEARAGRRDECVSAQQAAARRGRGLHRMTMRTTATAASRSPACCCARRHATESISPRASWWVIDIATSRPDTAPAAARSSSAMAMARSSRRSPMPGSPR